MSQPPQQQVDPEHVSQHHLPARSVPWTFPDSLIVLAMWFFFLIAFGGLVIYPLLLQATDETLAPAIQLPISSALLAIVTFAYVGRQYPGRARELFGSKRITPADFGWGFLAGIVALFLFAFGLGWILERLADFLKEDLPTVQEEFRRLAGNPRSVPFLILGAGVAAPIAEEMLYRGMMFTALRKRLPLWPAAGISGLVFALTHVQTTLEAYLLVLLVVAPLGIFLAIIYERRGTLLVPILAHAFFNLPQVYQLVSEASQR